LSARNVRSLRAVADRSRQHEHVEQIEAVPGVPAALETLAVRGIAVTDLDRAVDAVIISETARRPVSEPGGSTAASHGRDPIAPPWPPGR
jgi:hypothetical protein